MIEVKDGDGEVDCLPTTDDGGDGGCKSCILTVGGGREFVMLLLLLLLALDESRTPEANREEMVAESMMEDEKNQPFSYGVKVLMVIIEKRC